MQKPFLKFIFVTLIFGVFSFAISSANATKSTFAVDFQIDDLTFEKSHGFDKVMLRGCSFFANPGDPDLPVKYFQIAIPADVEVVSVQINSKTHQELPGIYRIFPAQENRPLADIPWKNKDYPFTQPNPQVYDLSQEFPGKLVEVLNNGFLAGQHLAGIAIYPLQYLPQQGKLIFYTQMEFTLIFASSESKPVPVLNRSKRGEAFYNRLVRSFVINPDDVNFESLGKGKQGLVEYLIITDTNYVSAFQPLADWKTQKGIPAKIVTLQWLNSYYPGVDEQERIRKCIIDFYQNHGTIWVLLGGDTNILPHRIAWVFNSKAGYYSWEDEIPCDLYYSDLDGDWNADGDNTYGEYEDNVDLYPDVIVGRAPASSLTEANTFVDKSLNYQTNPATEHLTYMLLAGEYLWPETDGGVLKDYIYNHFVFPLFPNYTRLYESLGNLNKTNFRNALNQGQGITNHCGHGNINVISIGPSSWYSSDMDALYNGDKLGLFYTYACLSNAIDFDCLGEHFVNNSNGGGFAYVGNSRYGWGIPGYPLEGPGPEFDIEFFRALFDNNSYHVGKTLSDSKIPFIPSAQQWNGRYDRWTMYTLNLLGDPELPIFTTTPLNLSASHPENIPVGFQTLDVYVEVGGSPAENALVCLSKAEEVYVQDFTGANGWVSLDIEPITSGDMFITVTAQNCIPYQDTILVSGEGPYPPLSFDLIFPPSGDTVWNLNTTLVWHEAIDLDTGDVITYTLYYAFDPMFFVKDSVTDISDTTYDFVGLTDDRTYYWKVKATDSYGLSTWCKEVFHFRTYLPEPPEPFSLILPPDGDTVWELSSNLVWHKASDPDPNDIISYTLYYSPDSLFVVKDSVAGLLDTNRLLSGLSDDQTYFWKVKAEDRFGLSAWSTETWKFHTYLAEPPDTFSLLFPFNEDIFYTQDTLTADWKDAKDPDPGDVVLYALLYGTSSVFDPDSTQVMDSLSESSYTLENLMGGEDYQHYYWKVKAYDGFGLLTWSNQTWEFEIYSYLAGDANGDKTVDISDVVFLINYLYASGPKPVPFVAGDANCDGEINASDVVYLINYLYEGGPEPCYPE